MNEKIETKEQVKGREQAPSKAHFLDLKLPIGCLLSAYGVLLGIYGLVTKKEMYDKSLGWNVNLMWGLIMIVVGGLFLLTAFLKRGKAKKDKGAGLIS